MLEKVSQLWRVKDVRNRILYVLAILVVFRLAAHVPVPGIRTENLANFFNQNQVLGLLNVFSGGALENFSVVMLGVSPYITASIIFQLLTMIIPRLEELSKEGERGYQKINQWTRLLTVPLAIVSGYGTLVLLQRGGAIQGQAAAGSSQLLGSLTLVQTITALIVITAGSIFLMWLGELISEKKVGNGISLLIFAGIVARVPSGIQHTIALFDPSQLFTIIGFMVVGLITIAGVVIVTEAQRNIPVSYARRIRGNRVYGGVDSHLPMRVNQAGVIPIIFAVSLVIFPSVIAQFFVRSNVGWIASLAQNTITFFQGGIGFDVVYFLLVVAFTFFYTSVVFRPDQIAENLQKQGGFIPGIRPGRQTMEYLGYVSNRIVLAGALFLGAIAVLPSVVRQATGATALSIGGTSLLIVVSVVIETVKQIESQLIVREYEGF